MEFIETSSAYIYPIDWKLRYNKSEKKVFFRMQNLND